MKSPQHHLMSRTAQYLRVQGMSRIDEYGPYDPRGAALWDAGCAIDPDDGNALGVISEPPSDVTEDVKAVVRVGLRKCRVEDGSPASLIREGDLHHITHMVTTELLAAFHVTPREGS